MPLKAAFFLTVYTVNMETTPGLILPETSAAVLTQIHNLDPQHIVFCGRKQIPYCHGIFNCFENTWKIADSLPYIYGRESAIDQWKSDHTRLLDNEQSDPFYFFAAKLASSLNPEDDLGLSSILLHTDTAQHTFDSFYPMGMNTVLCFDTDKNLLDQTMETVYFNADKIEQWLQSGISSVAVFQGIFFDSLATGFVRTSSGIYNCLSSGISIQLRRSMSHPFGCFVEAAYPAADDLLEINSSNYSWYLVRSPYFQQSDPLYKTWQLYQSAQPAFKTEWLGNSIYLATYAVQTGIQHEFFLDQDGLFYQQSNAGSQIIRSKEPVHSDLLRYLQEVAPAGTQEAILLRDVYFGYKKREKQQKLHTFMLPSYTSQ